MYVVEGMKKMTKQELIGVIEGFAEHYKQEAEKDKHQNQSEWLRGLHEGKTDAFEQCANWIIVYLD